MAQKGHSMVRQPATKFPHLRKKMAQNRTAAKAKGKRR
jgi:hypothetical protein